MNVQALNCKACGMQSVDVPGTASRKGSAEYTEQLIESVILDVLEADEEATGGVPEKSAGDGSSPNFASAEQKANAAAEDGDLFPLDEVVDLELAEDEADDELNFAIEGVLEELLDEQA